MTKAQKKIASNWCMVLFFLIVWVITDDWITAHWETIELPLYLAFITIVIFSNRKKNAVNGSQILNRIVKENTWIKLYLAVYGVALAIGINYVIFNNINLYMYVGKFELLCAIFLLILPILIIQQKEAYIDAGKEN